MASRIEDYGLIGNTRTAALVSRTAAVDWLCVPRFDSDACFAGLVGYDEHGTWSFYPTVPVRETRQRYRENSMVLETEFVCDGGVVRITDFMPIESDEDRCDLARIVEGIEGEVPMEMLLTVRFCYGADRPSIFGTRDDLHFVAGPDALVLHGPVDTRVTADGRVSALLNVRKGTRIPFQLGWHPSHLEAPAGLDVEAALVSTDSYWRSWAGRCTYEGRWKDLVVRSLLTLKALTYGPTGGIVAAPT